MIDHNQLREFVIRPVLKDIGLYSPAAEELLVLTAAVESQGGTYIHQIGGGPALGIYQMEPATHADIHDNFLRYKDGLKLRILPYVGHQLGDNHLVYDLAYATIMARIHYLRVRDPLPAADDISGLAQYWKDHYNTYLGAGTVSKAVYAYKKYVGG